MTDRRNAPGGLAADLDLGRLLIPAVNLKPGDANPVWAVTTESGRWVIKTQQPAGPWWFREALRAHRLERAAIDAGILTPRPAPTPAGSVGFWRPVGDGRYARAMRHLDGRHPGTPLDHQHAVWAGRTLALLERTDLPVDPADDEAAYRAYDLDDWDNWINEATAKNVLDTEQARRLAILAADVNQRSADQHDPGMLRILHRDVSRDNILTTAGGPALLDFDHAGAQRPWWEVVGHALHLASGDLTAAEPAERTIRTIITAYHAHGGAGGPNDETAFTGTLTARLSFAAWQLWIACGHRDNPEEFRAICGSGLRRCIAELDVIVGNARTWSCWLRL